MRIESRLYSGQSRARARTTRHGRRSARLRDRPAQIGNAGRAATGRRVPFRRSEEHTSELPSLMLISYAVFCLKNKTKPKPYHEHIFSATYILLSLYHYTLSYEYQSKRYYTSSPRSHYT